MHAYGKLNIRKRCYTRACIQLWLYSIHTKGAFTVALFLTCFEIFLGFQNVKTKA